MKTSTMLTIVSALMALQVTSAATAGATQADHASVTSPPENAVVFAQSLAQPDVERALEVVHTFRHTDQVVRCDLPARDAAEDPDVVLDVVGDLGGLARERVLRVDHIIPWQFA